MVLHYVNIYRIEAYLEGIFEGKAKPPFLNTVEPNRFGKFLHKLIELSVK